MIRLIGWICLLLAALAVACRPGPPCYDIRNEPCVTDEICNRPGGWPGICLDDKQGHRFCAYPDYPCPPTRYRWEWCASINGELIPLGGTCVTPEFLPDAGTDGSFPPADLSASSADQ